MTKTKSEIKVDVSGKGPSLGDFYGIFFEDISHSADGGLYAQMVQNGSFEFCEIDNKSYTPWTAWEPIGDVHLRINRKGSFFPKNPCYAEIYTLSAGKNGIRNTGYKGMYFKKGENYKLSFFAKGAMEITVALENGDGAVLDSQSLVLTEDWGHYSLILQASAETTEGSLTFCLNSDGRIGLDAVTLFPSDTYKNGIWRKDLAQALEELKPKFMRFPGGCLVHDGALNPDARDACYCWKNTIGAPEARPSKRNNWGYNQSLGLGYYEYFLLCEHFKCEPLPVLPAGWNPHRQEACPLDQMQPWVDDALDLIEFANGSEDTHWGKVRCELGHPKPFKLKYLAIGNEEVGAEFPERYTIIANAVKEKYPKIKLIHSAGPFPSGSEYERGYTAAKKDGADLIDEHYYSSTNWFLANVHRYDKFPAKKPKVFIGEYATKANEYYNAVVEAAYLTGMENAAHAVSLTCYAPLLCHTEYVNWQPDLIWFDNSRICKTPNYYVQKLFSNHLGDHILPVEKKNVQIHEPISMPINGMAEIITDGAEGWLWDVQIENLNNGDTVNFGTFNIDKDFKTTLSDVNLTDYEIRLSFKRSEAGRQDKGIMVIFGKKDDKNCFRWEIGGWQNQDSAITSCDEGENSLWDQHIFSIETGREYKLCLRVENRKISTFINGELMNSCEPLLPKIEDVYVTASKIKKTEEIIVKAVNVRNSSHSTSINLGKGSYSGILYSLSGYEKNDRNTLQRELIVPKEQPVSFSGSFDLKLPPMSVYVLRVKKDK